MQSCKRIFSLFALLVTSSKPLWLKFIVEALLGEKKDSIPSPNKFQGIEHIYMLQIFDTSARTLVKLQAFLESQRSST